MSAPQTLAFSMVEASLLVFMALFLGIVARLFLFRSDRWKQDARIPLDDTKPSTEDHTDA
jgi:hypothetical protein